MVSLSFIIRVKRLSVGNLFAIFILLVWCQQALASPVIKTEPTYYEVELRYASHVRDLHGILLQHSTANLDGNHALEKSGWSLDWSIDWKPSGHNCEVSKVQTTLIKRYTRPKTLSLPNDPKIRFAYMSFLEKVIDYHNGRFAILESAAREIESKVRWLQSPSHCDDASKEFRAAAKRIYNAYLDKLGDFDRNSHYGYTGGYYFRRYPWDHKNPSPEIHVDFDYYEFDLKNADTEAAVDQQISNYSTVIRNDRKPWGSAFWLVFWNYNLKRGEDSCHLEDVHTSIEIIYRMPKALTLPENPEIKAHYDRLYQNLMEHEAMHASSGIAAARKIQDYLDTYSETGDCRKTVKKILEKADAIVAEHRSRDKEFDRVTKHSGIIRDYVDLFGEPPWSTDGGRYQ